MAKLLVALSADRSRRRRQLFAAGATAVAIASLVGAAALDRSRRVHACAVEGAEVGVVWNDEVRQRVGEGLLASELSYGASTWQRVEPRFDAFARRWSDAREASCLAAEVEETRSDALAQRTGECLQVQREAFAAMIEALDGGEAAVVRGAAAAAARLPSPDDCLDDTKLATRPSSAPIHLAAEVDAVRRELAHAKGIGDSGLYTPCLALTEPAAARADELEWMPLQAEALVQLGWFSGLANDAESAESALERAVDLALRSDQRGLAVDAMGKLAFVTGAQRFQHERGRWWGRLAVALGEGLGAGEEVRLAGALGGLAAVHVSKGEYAEAEPLYLRVLEIRERTQGRDHPDLLAAYSGISHVYVETRQYGPAKAVLERALDNGEATHGPDHPDVATTLDGLGTVAIETGDFATAQKLFVRALAIKESALGPDHPWVGASLGSLGNVYDELDEHGKAIAAYERALAIFTAAHGAEHPMVAITMANMAVLYREIGETRRAKPLLERALAIQLRTFGPDHLRLALNYETLASVLLETGEPARAKEMGDRALAIREKTLGEDDEAVAETLVVLARIDDALGEHEQAQAARTRADSIFRQHGRMARSVR